MLDCWFCGVRGEWAFGRGTPTSHPAACGFESWLHSLSRLLLTYTLGVSSDGLLPAASCHPCGGRGLSSQLTASLAPAAHCILPPMWGAWVERWRLRSSPALDWPLRVRCVAGSSVPRQLGPQRSRELAVVCQMPSAGSSKVSWFARKKWSVGMFLTLRVGF